jgi:hypothetical protein
MVAELDEIAVAITTVITGAGLEAAEVVNVKLPETACVPPEFDEATA